MKLNALNGQSQTDFTSSLAAIFEHSAWVPEQTWSQRPFASIEGLHAALCATLARADQTAQLQLVRAHPQLAGKAAIRGELTDASTREQRGAGLDQCTAEEYARLTALNTRYEQKFGFPFILAVRGHTRQSIIANLDTRIGNTRESEIAEALRQIERIAWFRLGDLLEA